MMDTKKKILLADDEPDITRVLKPILENNNYQVVIASDGSEAIAKAIDHNPHLILLDIKMPNMDGFLALRELKQNDSTKQIPVLMLTVVQDLPSMSEALKLGASDFLVKTCETNELLRYIDRYVL